MQSNPDFELPLVIRHGIQNFKREGKKALHQQIKKASLEDIPKFDRSFLDFFRFGDFLIQLEKRDSIVNSASDQLNLHPCFPQIPSNLINTTPLDNSIKTPKSTDLTTCLRDIVTHFPKQIQTHFIEEALSIQNPIVRNTQKLLQAHTISNISDYDVLNILREFGISSAFHCIIELVSSRDTNRVTIGISFPFFHGIRKTEIDYLRTAFVYKHLCSSFIAFSSSRVMRELSGPLVDHIAIKTFINTIPFLLSLPGYEGLPLTDFDNSL